MQSISPMKVIYGLLISSLVLSGVGCTGPGFSIPVNPQAMAEPVDGEPTGIEVVHAGDEYNGDTDTR